MNYGIIIKKLRKDKFNENQVEFSKRIGITQPYLCSIELGNKKPSIELLENISVLLEIPLPIIFWSSLTENDISNDKKEIFNQLKPSVDNLIMSFF
ncbi:helix-turn-helix protein [compost metagenome]